jgi:hypothetical protein
LENDCVHLASVVVRLENDRVHLASVVVRLENDLVRLASVVVRLENDLVRLASVVVRLENDLVRLASVVVRLDTVVFQTVNVVFQMAKGVFAIATVGRLGHPALRVSASPPSLGKPYKSDLGGSLSFGAAVPVGPGTSALPFAEASFWHTDASCHYASAASSVAASGTVTFDVITPSRIAGSFDLYFGQDHVTGTFDAPVCNDPADIATQLTNVPGCQ